MAQKARPKNPVYYNNEVENEEPKSTKVVKEFSDEDVKKSFDNLIADLKKMADIKQGKGKPYRHYLHTIAFIENMKRNFIKNTR